jgi:hypothetical protein
VHESAPDVRRREPRAARPPDNFAAELLLKELGSHVGPTAAAPAASSADRQVSGALGPSRRRGADGSGLSSHGPPTPAGQIALLRAGRPLRRRDRLPARPCPSAASTAR